jgi:hypothetical protein
MDMVRFDPDGLETDRRGSAYGHPEDNHPVAGEPVSSHLPILAPTRGPWLTVLAAALLSVSTAVAQDAPVPEAPPRPDGADAVTDTDGAASDTIPSDTYADEGARRMIERGRAARGTEAEGLDSYEATITERVYVGLSAARFRRERGLWLSEQIARVRWDASGQEIYRWLGSRQEVPIVGDAVDIDEGCRTREGDETTCGQDPDDLIPLDPQADRLMMGGEAFLHPLADSAPFHYRYASGDTLRIVLPNSDRRITVVQIRLEPRRADFELLAGALWFDLETAALVRGAYRPARDFDLEIDEPEDADEVPGFIKPITASVDHMIVDYALQELRWWLPWRIRFEGEGRAGRLLRVPVVVEISISDFALNEADTLDIAEEDLPPGWSRRVDTETRDDGTEIERIALIPPRDSLRNSPLLSEEFFAGEPVEFSQVELDRVREDLDAVVMREAVGLPSLSGLAAFRYNRVEALSGGYRQQVSLGGSLSGWGEIRLGLGDLVPNVEAGVREELVGGSVEAAAYYRLQSANDWGEPLNLESSINALLLGYDFGQYYRAGGVSIDLKKESGAVRYDLRAFAEAQRSEEKNTDISLANLLGRSDPPPNMEADAIEIAGISGRLRAQHGIDPSGLVSTGTLWGEVGAGDAEYGRIAAGVTAGHPLFWRLAGSVELSGGTTFGDVPTQRLYYLASPRALRAFEADQVLGEAFWLARAELALGYPVVRFVTFSDFAWAGDRSDPEFSEYAVTVGAGASLLDGLLRVDLARGVRGPGPLRWQLHLYLDALL